MTGFWDGKCWDDGWYDTNKLRSNNGAKFCQRSCYFEYKRKIGQLQYV